VAYGPAVFLCKNLSRQELRDLGSFFAFASEMMPEPA
jgi:hypothetical protein